MKKTTKKQYIAIAVVLILFIILPLFGVSSYNTGVLTTCLIYAAFGVAWNLIGGYGGQVSWCHAAFVAIGAYTGICFHFYLDWSPLLTMPLGILISVAFATLIGRATLTYSGNFFAIATIAFQEMARVVLLNIGVTKGSAGIAVPFRGERPLHLNFLTNTPYYYLALVLLVLCLLITYLFTRSKSGYYLRTIKGNELASQTLGCNTPKVREYAFQVSAAMASVAGMVYAYYMNSIEPNSICGSELSIKIGAIALIGGSGTLFGPVIGAFLVIPVIELASKLVGASGGTQIFYGLFLIIVMICIPSGVITLFTKDFWKNRTGRIKIALLKKEEKSG